MTDLKVKVTIESKASFFKYYSDDADKKEKILAMKKSPFRHIMEEVLEQPSHKALVCALASRLDVNTRCIKIGGHNLKICAHDIAYLVKMKNEGAESFEAGESGASVMVPAFFEELWKVSGIAIPNKVESETGVQRDERLHRKNLQQLLQTMKVSQKNKEDFAKLMTYYLVNFILCPPRDYYGRIGFFNHLTEAEGVNWPKVIVDTIYEELIVVKRLQEGTHSNVTRVVTFYPEFLEAWQFFKLKKAEDVGPAAERTPFYYYFAKSELKTRLKSINCFLDKKHIISKSIFCAKCAAQSVLAEVSLENALLEGRATDMLTSAFQGMKVIGHGQSEKYEQ